MRFRATRGSLLPDLAGAAVLAALFALSAEYLEQGDCSFGLSLLGRACLYGVGFFAVLVGLRAMVGGFHLLKSEEPQRGRTVAGTTLQGRHARAASPTQRVRPERHNSAGWRFGRALRWVWNPAHPVRAVAVGAALLLACWLPYLVLMSPGNLNYDTTGQIIQYFSLLAGGDYPLTDHHPVFDTLVFGWMFDMGRLLTGDMRAGLQACILFQSLATAAAISWSVSRGVFAWSVSRPLALGLLLFAGLLPVFPLAVCSLSKDTFFSWLYVLFFTLVVDVAQSRCKAVRNPGFLVALIVVSVLMGLTKKFGVYVAVGTFVALLAGAPKTRSVLVRLAVPALCAALAVFVVMPQVVAALGGAPGGKQEMLSVPMQQTALACIRHGDEMPEEEVQAIDALLECDTLAERYDPTCADPVKGVAKDKQDEAYAGYMAVWLQQGFRYPEAYFDAWAVLDAAMYSDEACLPIFSSLLHVDGTDYVPDYVFEKASFNQDMSDRIAQWYDALTKIPALRLLLAHSLFSVVVPVFVAVSVIRSKQWRLLPALAPIAVSIVGLVLGPLTHEAEMFRYVMPFLYTTPAMIMLARCALVSQDAVASRAVSRGITNGRVSSRCRESGSSPLAFERSTRTGHAAGRASTNE